MTKRALARAEAARLYVEEQLSTREVGQRMTPRRSGEGVRLLLLAEGVELRPSGDKLAGRRAEPAPEASDASVKAPATFWTKEKVAEAVRLWNDGKSATEVAKAIKAVSRSAVIAKIDRLRPKGVITREKAVNVTKALANHNRHGGVCARLRPPKCAKAPAPLSASATRVFTLPETIPLPAEPPEGPGLCTILSIGAHMCRWPIGDPQDEGFTLCGRRSGDATYCPGHAQRAYSPPSDKRRSTVKELERSLRRYA